MRILLPLCYFMVSAFCSGVYDDSVTLQFLKNFHQTRVQILSEAGADLIAFETTPNKMESQV